MPTVKTRVDDATYATLVAKRKAAGLPSVSALFLRESGVLTDQVAASEIARRALARAKKKSGEPEYLLRDLFAQKEWQKYPKGARLRAGKMFNAEVASAVHGIRATRKSSTNHQYYQTA
jgi:hypothetical protein